MSYVCPNGHDVGKRHIVGIRCETPGCAARIAYVPSAMVVSLAQKLRVADKAMKRAVGCEHPETCGGPLVQPICEPCIAFARAHLWTTSPDPIEG